MIQVCIADRASKANSPQGGLPTRLDLASVDVPDRQIHSAPRDGRESAIPTLTEARSPPDPSKYISGYAQLSKHGVGFYPIRPDKSPAVAGKLDRKATVDAIKIRCWAEYCSHQSFAARILRHSRLMVIDTDSPFKNPHKVGPDGELIFCGLLEEHTIILPPCPTVQTPSGGFHRYFLVPKWPRIRSAIGLWPGIDILATGSNVILPGSNTEAGTYRLLRSFDECPIPEAPKALVSLIREAQTARQASGRSRQKCFYAVPDGKNSVVSGRQWWLLFKNRVFRSFWNRNGSCLP